jgi:hypothetical protein
MSKNKKFGAFLVMAMITAMVVVACERETPTEVPVTPTKPAGVSREEASKRSPSLPSLRMDCGSTRIQSCFRRAPRSCLSPRG